MNNLTIEPPKEAVEARETKVRGAVRRLQIGSVSPKSLSHPSLHSLIDPSWVHLSEEPATTKRQWLNTAKSWISSAIRPIVSRLSGKRVFTNQQIQERTTFQPFNYEFGGRLDFKNDHLSYIYSDHYFQRLFLDEAAALIRECYRSLEEGGVLRISVPDPDLRRYEPYELPGYPGTRFKWTHPSKHKTRWSVYSLTYVLEAEGFFVNPVCWCDKLTHHRIKAPTVETSGYEQVRDRQFVFDLSYCRRKGTSLIIDAIKPGKGQSQMIGHLASKLHPVDLD